MLKRVLTGQVESQSDEDVNVENEFELEPPPEEVSFRAFFFLNFQGNTFPQPKYFDYACCDRSQCDCIDLSQEAQSQISCDCPICSRCDFDNFDRFVIIISKTLISLKVLLLGCI